MDVVTLGESSVGRAVFEPGWRWPELVKPVAGTDTCQVPSAGYVVSWRLHVGIDDGLKQEIGLGDAVTISPARRLDRWGRTLRDARDHRHHGGGHRLPGRPPRSVPGPAIRNSPGLYIKFARSERGE